MKSIMIPVIVLMLFAVSCSQNTEKYHFNKSCVSDVDCVKLSERDWKSSCGISPSQCVNKDAPLPACIPDEPGIESWWIDDVAHCTCLNGVCENVNRTSCPCQEENVSCGPFEEVKEETYRPDGCVNECKRQVCVKKPFIANSSNILACETDEDCVQVPNSCCASANCDYRAINKEFELEWRMDFGNRCSDVGCIAVLCQRHRFLYPRCIEKFNDTQQPMAHKECAIVDDVGPSIPSDDELSKLNVDNAMFVLQRGPCFGTCPSYTITIYANGTAYYDGDYYAERQGRYEGFVSKLQIQRILWMFEATPYFAFKDEYSAPITDMQTVTTTYRYYSRTKTVSNYAKSGPPSLELLEDEIDNIAHSIGWSPINETS